MPRKARNKTISNYSHVIVQGLNREFIFDNYYDIEKYREIIKEKLEDSEVDILGYCFMSNHSHFLMHYDDISCLSKFMKFWDGSPVSH